MFKPFSNHFSILLIVLLGQSVFGLKDALGPEGMNLYAVHQKGITGTGVNIGLLSSGNARDNHAGFQHGNESAVILYDFTGSGLSYTSHDTEMAGIILSKGSQTHPEQTGGAPGAKIHSARFSNNNLYRTNITKALDTLIKQQNCRIIMTGIQLPEDIVASDGNSDWSKLYDYYAETYDVTFASAAGNSEPRVTVFGDLHNGITTAGLVRGDPNGIYDTIGSASNRGPTADGRKKPEVAAITHNLAAPTSGGKDAWKTLDPTGKGLTSYAIPHTAALAALLLETAEKSSVPDDDKTEVIKAVIINTAKPILSETIRKRSNPADAVTGWESDCGYGLLDALAAYETLTSHRIRPQKPSKYTKGWSYDTIDKNESHEYDIPAVKGQRLVVTVTWHRRLNKIGKKYFDEPVRFYLDLKLLSPTGKLLAFETPGSDNLIKTDTLITKNGNYKLIIKNPTTVKGRDYGMAFELSETYP